MHFNFNDGKKEQLLSHTDGYQTEIIQCINTYHAAGECRRQVKHLTYFVKNVNNFEFQYYIRNHHQKCIQILSTNMPSIGLVIPEITCEILEF